MIGKLRLALSPFEPEWANVALYVTARGLTTSPMPVGLRAMDAELDLVDHVLVLRTSDGGIERRPLGGPVADFYHGRTVNLVVGYGPGGGYDLCARLVARHIGRYIPGNPTLVPKNMEGGGGMRLANFLYNAAPKDGSRQL